MFPVSERHGHASCGKKHVFCTNFFPKTNTDRWKTEKNRLKSQKHVGKKSEGSATVAHSQPTPKLSLGAPE